MKFYSTRNRKHERPFSEAIFQGLAPDGGLYHPVATPDLTDLFETLRPETPFSEVAGGLTSALLSEELSRDQAMELCSRAFPFSPALKEADKDLSILELFHGPSGAFKDFGASFLAASMETFLKDQDRSAVILTATSGDTGSAVARAFYEKKGIDVVILYPSGRVSPLQEKQLTTLGKNIHALEVKGSFDDCQRMVKEAFIDKKLKETYGLSSANSINLGRLLPQSFYYVWAWAQTRGEEFIPAGESDLTFCVPSGNFGNITAGLLAQSWGLPVKKFIAATNANDVVPAYLSTGIYTPRASEATLSNAMDVGAPSNFERIQALFHSNVESIRAVLEGDVVTDAETLRTMAQADKRGLELCPHTAVGYLASERYLARPENQGQRVISLATAHPGKFLEVFEQAVGRTPELPERLKSVLDQEKKATMVNNSLEDLKAFLKKKF